MARIYTPKQRALIEQRLREQADEKRRAKLNTRRRIEELELKLQRKREMEQRHG